MKEMIKAMVQEMVAQSIKEVMAEMFNTSTEPTVAKAEVTTVSKQTMSLKDAAAVAKVEVADVKQAVYKTAELVALNGRNIMVFNDKVSKDIWQINYITLKEKFPNMKYDKQNNGFRWNKEHTGEFITACQSYQVITEITAEHKVKLEEYRKERARKRAEYYANLAK